MSSPTLVARSYYSDQFTSLLTKKVFDGRYTASSVIVTLSIAIGLYNSLELFLLITTTFKKWQGLYFWSLTLCNLGVMLYCFGMMLTYFELGVLWFAKVVLDLGWGMMVTCQSLVLYSRLGLVLENERILKFVKWMIIIDSIVLVVMTNTTDFGTTYVPNSAFPEAYFYVEHLQVMGFNIQELIISGLYVWKAFAILKIVSKARTRSMLWQLLLINLIIMCMDVSITLFTILFAQC